MDEKTIIKQSLKGKANFVLQGTSAHWYSLDGAEEIAVMARLNSN